MDIAKKYQKLTSIQHILKRPGMYIGGTDEQDTSIWVLNKSEPVNIINKTIRYSPGLYKIFDEIIVNAYDQTVRDKTVTKIKVDFDVQKNEITVYNDGVGIDVVIHPKEKIYVPELIFAHLRTSTSFSEDQASITGGIHGYGAKLTAIFSTYFKVDICDPVRKKRFVQTYKNNLSNISPPTITNCDKSGYVKITFKPDLKYFKIDKLTDDVLSLMERRVYDLAALTGPKVKVFLNNSKIEYNTFDKFVDLFTKNEQIKELCDPQSNRWKIIVTKSDGKFRQVSFVNGIYTNNGGRHVDYVINQIIKEMKDIISSKYKSANIKSQFIKDQMWIFISSVIENPSFSSQTKDELMTAVPKFGSTCEISNNFVKKVFSKLDFDTTISQQIKYLQFTELVKTDKKAKKTIKGIKKLYDANYAGTKKSMECSLILTEGDSAKTMAISGLSVIPKANNTYGVFPLKGKLLNVREATHTQIINNEEFKNLKQIIGLTINKVYTKDNIKEELRYGSIILMMDADVDGSHIKGLFINMLHYYWPSLLKIEGFIKIFITPVVKVSLGNKTLSFYNNDDYNRWKKSTDNYSRWTIKYYKGLGTNTATEAKEYFNNLGKHLINFIWVESSDTAIELAFAKEKADERKLWLKDYDESNTIKFKETENKVTFKDFINKELIHFSNYDNIRSIPSLIDGFKPSQRKVLYAALKRNLTSDIKVAQFVGYASEQTSYHHGEMSMTNTIIAMAQNFVGSNNINLLVPKGQFGTRLLGGKDHSSARYIFTKLEEITRHIFHKDDDEILTYLDDDGFMIEPIHYVPIIPMVLVNGCEGIGTGYSTYVPKFNPLDIIENLKRKLKNEKNINMIPWYNKFKGTIVKSEKNVYLSKGVYVRDKDTIRIIELPITSWTEPYKFFLDTTIAEKSFVKSIINNSTDSTVDFTIKLATNANTNPDAKTDQKFEIDNVEKMLGLVRVINMNNMYLHDSKGQIKLYNDAKHILDEFFKIRLFFYQKRKDHMLKKLEDEIAVLEAKVKFIVLIINKKIDIVNKPINKIIDTLEKHKLLKIDGSFDYLIKMSFYSLTKEKVDELNNLLKEKKRKYDILKKKRIEDIWLDDLDILKQMLVKLKNIEI